MHTKTYLTIALCLLVTLSACRDEVSDVEILESEHTELIPAPDSIFLVQEDVVALVEAPHRHFDRAGRHVARQEREEGAGELRAAARIVLRRASHATGSTKADLAVAAQELESLAERMVLGPAVTPREFDRVFALAYRVLAAHHRQRAEAAWARKRVSLTALELNAASVYLEQATEHVEESPEEVQSVAVIVQRTERLARSLVERQGYTSEDVQHVFVKLGQEIDHLGQRLDADDAS